VFPPERLLHASVPHAPRAVAGATSA
jgi:hypothetical protein